ncbi:calcium/sodium antiporter [Microbacterium invictum]|uniref:Cation:H+ antiporter n=1 Tax=Microbacterium invictum TaxID=515415 RepID=A0AA40SKZ6_9MICO|nr:MULTISPECIES: calcium/sodium antiporter [Microbacterium]MBB4138220.1 cation:H+ antiporter [Microbacterium invictum]
MTAWLWVILGLVLLIVGAELIVRYGARLASRLGISSIMIGLTVVSIGTSAPELAVGIDAARIGQGSLALGNIAGTNLVNLLLIMGLAAALRLIPIALQTLRLDLPMIGAVALLLLVFVIDGRLDRIEGGVLVAVAIGYTLALVRWARRESAAVLAEYENEYHDAPRETGSLVLAIVLLIAGIAIILLGAGWLVTGAVDLAEAMGVSSTVIGLTVIAIGTSAPELVTAIVSTYRGDRDIALGNLIGSSTYNITIILGITVLAAPIAVDHALVFVDIPMMIAGTFLVGTFMMSGRRLTRVEGVIMIGAYLAYLAYLLAVRT